MTNTELASLARRHEEAGKRYAAACDELRASIVDLAAVEGLLPSDPLHTFEASPPDELTDLRHRKFMPTAPRHIRAAVKDRVAELAAAEVVQ